MRLIYLAPGLTGMSLLAACALHPVGYSDPRQYSAVELTAWARHHVSKRAGTTRVVRREKPPHDVATHGYAGDVTGNRRNEPGAPSSTGLMTPPKQVDQHKKWWRDDLDAKILDICRGC